MQKHTKFYIKFGWWEDLDGMINYFVLINVSWPKSYVSSLHLFDPRVVSFPFASLRYYKYLYRSFNFDTIKKPFLYSVLGEF